MPTSSRPRYLFVVRSGEFEVYRILRERLEEPGLVEVIWDRRVRERRTVVVPVEHERRRGERRGPPPATWATQGFLLARRESNPQPD